MSSLESLAQKIVQVNAPGVNIDHIELLAKCFQLSLYEFCDF